jgi:Protein of unknown function (DUF4058)
MPSPFPGMDPYLEDPGLWPDVHHEIITSIREQLLSRLGLRYYVRIEERIYISDDEDPGREVILPDVRVGQRPKASGPALLPGASSVAVAEPIVIDTLLDDEIHEPFLAVIDRDDRHVVTVIEVLSPTNKVAGSRGRTSFREKRAEILSSPSHWVEIDLLRTGTPSVPRQMLSRGDYFVSLSRAGERRHTFVWPMSLTERLHGVRIPLQDKDPDVSLDLQAVLDSAYDRAGYNRIIDYGQSPRVPLSPEHAAWADQLLRDKGLR